MNTHGLLNLLNVLRTSDTMQGLSSKPRTLLLFRNEFNKFSNTGARMLDSIYHMTLKLIKKRNFWHENVKILSSLTQRYNRRLYITLRNM